MTVQEILSSGTTGLLFGLGSVFVVLVLLIACIALLKHLTRSKNQEAAVKAPVVATTPKDEDDDEGELVAVIAAAIACMAQREGKKYKIKSYRRIKNNNPAWNIAGRRN